MSDLSGKLALVTGGASGIGKAVVERLSSEGASVVVADVNDVDGEKVAGWDALVDELPALDVVHLNAGVTTQNGDVRTLTEEQYRRIMRVNVDGVVYGARAVTRAMAARGGGAIVATASVAGLIGFSPDPIYTLTKHAVVGFVRAMAPQLRELGITINAVNPAIVETPLVGEEAMKMLRAANIPTMPPSQIADAVVSAITSGRTGECWVCTKAGGNAPHVFADVSGIGL
jgi:NAD(P)-dependent dehydrogenase (short-subunit alcohol dehydrogenase family)